MRSVRVSAQAALSSFGEFGIERDRVDPSPDPEPEPDYNVAPTKRIYAVLTRRSRAADEEEEGVRGVEGSKGSKGSERGAENKADSEAG